MPITIDPSFEFKIAQDSIKTLRRIVADNPAGEAALNTLLQDRERNRQRLDRERERNLDVERSEKQVVRFFVFNGYDYPELTDYARDLLHQKRPMRVDDLRHVEPMRENVNQGV